MTKGKGGRPPTVSDVGTVKQVSIRLGGKDLRDIARLAKHLGITRAEVMRQALRWLVESKLGKGRR